MLQILASENRIIAQDALAFILCLAALFWGGGPERAVAATWFFIFEIAGRAYRAIWGASIQLVGVDYFLASSDILAGIIWILIALYANRTYVLWIAGLQMLAIMAHLARGLAESISPIGYGVMVVAPGWFQLFLLAGGLIGHVRRKRKYGPYRDWRIVSNPRERLVLGEISARLRPFLPAPRDR